MRICLAIGLMIILLSGCGQQYKAERMSYFVNKSYSNISKDLRQVDKNEVKRIIDSCNIIIKNHPDWAGIVKIKFIRAHLYFLKKDFKGARTEFNKIINDYPEQIEFILQSYLLIGLSYEYEDKWDKALAVFKEMMQNYPLSPASLQIPQHIAGYYVSQGKSALAETTLLEAISNNEKLINQYSFQPELVQYLETLILNYYKELNDWEAVRNTLERLSDKYLNTEIGAEALFELAKLYETQQKIDKAISAYQQFITTYPNHNLVSTAKERLNSLSLSHPEYFK